MAKLMEVLEFLDNSGNIMVKRVPDDGPAEIKRTILSALFSIAQFQNQILFEKDSLKPNVIGVISQEITYHKLILSFMHLFL